LIAVMLLLIVVAWLLHCQYIVFERLKYLAANFIRAIKIKYVLAQYLCEGGNGMLRTAVREVYVYPISMVECRSKRGTRGCRRCLCRSDNR
jgi:hypothetical protein